MGQQIIPTGAFDLENAVCLNILPRAELEREGFVYHMEFFYSRQMTHYTAVKTQWRNQ